MSLSSTSLPKPKNWQDFESKIRELFACVLKDPNTQLNGRSGQKQNGVDVYGYRCTDTDCLVGVQCKKKYESSVTEGELRSEVQKAKNFRPAISEFVLVTTAPRDQKIQEAARVITAELNKTDHPFVVCVWGWDDIEEHVSKHRDAWKAFDPTWTPFGEQGFDKVFIEFDELKQTLEARSNGTSPPSYKPTDVVLDENNENTPRQGQITAFQQLIDNGHVQAALEQLLKLKNDEWAIASRSERYRILVGIASTKLKLGEQEEAGSLLLDACNECPEHKNAQKNRASGYLLTNDNVGAAKLARSILASDKDSAEAAGVLIQSMISDISCTDPLSEVPAALHDSEEVLIAYIHFRRSRNNQDWVPLARSAVEKYPNSHLLKLFSAEAVLDMVVRTERDSIAGGMYRNISSDEFNGAVKILHSEARDAINSGYALLPSTATNAALALRFSDDLTSAKEILDSAISQYPKDESLRLQRALIAFFENDMVAVLDILPNKPSGTEALGIIAIVLAQTGKADEALSMIENIDESGLPEHIKIGLLDVRANSYITHGNKQLAIDTVARRVAAEPDNLSVRTLLIQICRNNGDIDCANRAFEEALAVVSDDSSLVSRLELSFEARKIGRDDAIIDLLKGRVAIDRESEGLHVLISASINAGFWVTAREMLDAVTQNLKSHEWFLRADAILAINTGDAAADVKIARYLKQCPNDLEMTLARIGVWQHQGREIDIRRIFQKIKLTEIEGRPEQRIRLAALLCHYGDVSKGLEYGYSVLMDNWDDPKAHLAYQGLVFLNEHIDSAMPSADAVAENMAVCLLTEGRERHYRIENEHHTFFENDRLDPESDLASLLIGKHVGDKFKLQENIGSKEVEVLWIRPVYIDVFHRSLDQFNERFPRADGLQKFTYDPAATDPVKDMREITKARAKADQHILGEYRSKGIPLSFAAALIGKDPIDAWGGLQSVGIEFQVCHGSLPEREDALKTIQQHGQNGCVLDAITLSVVRRLGIEKAITAVCGTIHTPQSVINLLVTRAHEAKQNIGKQEGFISWRDEQLVYEEHTKESLKVAADEREKEATWARRNAIVAHSMPKKDFSRETKNLIDMVSQAACDPVVAADGNDLLLVSEDLGLRVWATETFKAPTSWLQPILSTARNKGYIEYIEYCEAINMLALSNHTYISLDPRCLMHQARKGNYSLTDELTRLLCVVGGPSADLPTNSGVLSAFIDALWEECADVSKIKIITSEALCAITRGRQEDQRQIIGLFLSQLQSNKRTMSEHTLSWLVGHSIGMPYFDELIQMQKKK